MIDWSGWLKEWLEAGFSEKDFWSNTPRQINMHFAAAKVIKINAYNDRAWVAYHVAMLTRMKKLPQYSRLIYKTPKKPQAWQEQMKIVEFLNELYGGKDLRKLN